MVISRTEIYHDLQYRRLVNNAGDSLLSHTRITWDTGLYVHFKLVHFSMIMIKHG